MSVVYVKEQGAILRKRGSRILVEKDDQTLNEILLHHTTSVSVFGNVQVTTQALSELLERGISLALYTRHGRLKGHLVSETSKNVEIRVAQFRAAFDEARCLEAARAIVQTKLLNSAALLEDYRSNYAIAELPEAIDGLQGIAATCAATLTRDELLGKEGAGAAMYFRAFAKVNRSGIPFEGRRKHPATDPLNALLSLGYTFAMNELRGLLEGCGLEPHVGLLHAVDYGRPSLALDLLEAFRAPFIDRLTLRLVNERILADADFARRVDGSETGSVVLTPDAFPRYVECYEGAVSEPRTAAPTGFRGALAAEAEKLRNWLRDGGAFSPFREE